MKITRVKVDQKILTRINNNSLSANPTKWSNALKKFVDHFVGLTLEGLRLTAFLPFLSLTTISDVVDVTSSSNLHSFPPLTIAVECWCHFSFQQESSKSVSNLQCIHHVSKFIMLPTLIIFKRFLTKHYSKTLRFWNENFLFELLLHSGFSQIFHLRVNNSPCIYFRIELQK